MFSISEAEASLLQKYIQLSIQEDQHDPLETVLPGDHSALACLPATQTGAARLLVKSEGIIAGIELAKLIAREVDANLVLEQYMQDGDAMKYGDIAFTLHGSERSILAAERIILNCMQRMSGIATTTNVYTSAVAHTQVKVLDTRKTTPNFRVFEKWAVRMGGGHNHRFGLYDMIMLKDNHIDFCGGVNKAILAVKEYQEKNGLKLKVEVESRNLDDVKAVLETGFCDRVMFDNFSVEKTAEAVQLVGGRIETESSGGITLDTIAAYAETGVDFISVGALTHSSRSLDLSLKAIK
jgi:nicotinate-nucleotide pyrophosphorylase (carboxylating)